MIFSSHPLHLILLLLLLVMAIIQGWYYLGYYRKAVYKEPELLPQKITYPPLTVIICARNEAANLNLFLPEVLEQDYPSYEVVVVNDCSDDETDNVLGGMLERYSHLRVSSIQKDPGFTHAKKLAMLIGIKAAANDMLVFTDADCRPVSDKWLKHVASSFREGTDIVIGYGGYADEKGLLNRYIRYETMFTAMQYTGMALAGAPYMGVGRNLAYRRTYFFSRGGFGPHNHIMSGDDDLFVNRNATPDNCSVMLSPDSFTRSVAPRAVPEWIKQKRRHFTTANYYKTHDKARLFLEPFTRVSYYVLLTCLIIMQVSLPFAGAIALVRLGIRGVIMRRAALTFNERRLWFFSLFFDILSPFVSSVLYLTRTRKAKRTQSWK